MPAYVIVWENNTLGHSKVKGHEWPGHSSINIGKEFWDSDTPNGTYVSYWPATSAGFGLMDVLTSKKQKASTSCSIISDVLSEGYLPDHVIELIATDEVEKKMAAAWAAIRQKPGGPSYSNLRKNCSTICSRILHAGGFYGKSWAVNNNWVWSPADVAKLALSAGGRRLTWDEYLKVLAESFISPDQFTSEHGIKITHARSGAYCSTNAPVAHQQDQRLRVQKV